MISRRYVVVHNPLVSIISQNGVINNSLVKSPTTLLYTLGHIQSRVIHVTGVSCHTSHWLHVHSSSSTIVAVLGAMSGV